jgi:hypothetical protein
MVVATAAVMATGMVVVTMASGMVVATGISAGITVILAVTIGAAGSRYSVRFRAAIFAATALLRSATPRSGRAIIATR